MYSFEQFNQLIKTNLFSEYFIGKLYKEITSLINASLEEDLGEIGDITSQALLKNDVAKANIIAKQNGVFSGGFLVRMVYQTVDETVGVICHAKESEFVTNKKSVISITGPAKSILIGERTALNFLSRISGVSTLANKFVEAVKGSNIKILDTRKTCPGWRYLDKYAVKMGGGFNHRIGLFDMVLIKDNHIAAANGIQNAVQFCRELLKSKNLNLKIEVETKDLDEVNQALQVNVDRIMLDNMSVSMINKAVEIIDKKCEIEISGGVNLTNIGKYHNTGVDFISIGELTHSAKGFDFSLLIN